MMSNYYCTSCYEVKQYDVSPFVLKCALNPHLTIKEYWDDEDWKAPIGICKCGGIIEAGYPKTFANISMGEHERLSWSLGCNEEDLPTMRKLHPGAEFVKSIGGGYQMLIKNRTEKIRRMKERGFEEYG